MDDPAIALILEECLALLHAGEEVDAIVSRFPDFSETLEPILRLAAELQETADDAIDVPMDALEDIGEFIRAQWDDLTDQSWEGSQVKPDETPITSWREVEEYRSVVRARFSALISNSQDDDLQALREIDVDGERVRYSRAELLANVLLHERGHHGDVSTLLYQLGREMPTVDYRFFVLARRGYT